MRPRSHQEIAVTIFIEKYEDGFYAYAPALKGLHVGGDTEEEVLAIARDGIIWYLESMIEHGEPFPEGKYLEVKKLSEPKTKEVSVLCLSQTMHGNKSKISRPRMLYVDWNEMGRNESKIEEAEFVL